MWACRCSADKKGVRSARNESVKNESELSVNIFFSQTPVAWGGSVISALHRSGTSTASTKKTLCQTQASTFKRRREAGDPLGSSFLKSHLKRKLTPPLRYLKQHCCYSRGQSDLSASAGEKTTTSVKLCRAWARVLEHIDVAAELSQPSAKLAAHSGVVYAFLLRLSSKQFWGFSYLFFWVEVPLKNFP